MNQLPQLEDINVFILVIKYASFAKAAESLGKSPAYISKRIQVLEECLGVKLLNRSTRHLSLTTHGNRIYTKSINLLMDMENIINSISDQIHTPSGSLFITSSLGFGRRYIADLIAELSEQYPLLSIRFDTIDQIHDIPQSQTHLDIRIGNDISPHLIARKLFSNKRILCASRQYLEEEGTPEKLQDLLDHECVMIKERDQPLGSWDLDSDKGKRNIKVQGKLSSNNGEIVKEWALLGKGIMLRSIWDIQQELHSQKLIHILPEYWQDADIWAVYSGRTSDSAKLRVCINFFQENLPTILKKHTLI